MGVRSVAIFTAVAATLLSAAATSAQQPEPSPAIPSATLDDTLEITGDALDAEQIASRMFVDVQVNGKGPFRFLVDSGADRSVIGAGLARRLALPQGEGVTLHGMAGTLNVPTVLIERLRIGSSDIPAITAPALPEKFLGAQGLLGIDALAEQRLMLDFDARKITIQDARKPVQNEDGEIVVTARRRKGQLILTQASAGGGRVYAVIDTGAQLTTGNSALQARVFRGRRPPTSQAISIVSVTGQSIMANLVILPEIRIGGITLHDVPVAFVDAPPFALFGLAKDPALLLGTDILQSFRRVSLDFGSRKVRFVLRR